MKKNIAIVLSLILLILLPSGIQAEELWTWEGMRVEVKKLEESKVLQPSEMKSTEYAVMLTLETDEALWKNEELRARLYEEGVLEDQGGNVYTAAASGVGSDKPTFIYFYCIPKGVEVSELKYVLKGADAGEEPSESETEDEEPEEPEESKAEESEESPTRRRLSASEKRNTVWTRSAFEQLLDCSFEDFKPESPKANAFFFLLADESQCFPNKAYAEHQTQEEQDRMLKAIRSLKAQFEEHPLFEQAEIVEDPEQASVLLELNFQYPYQARYFEGQESYEGYNCELKIRALHGGSKVELARISGLNKLPNEVDVGDTPDGGDFCAEPPALEAFAELQHLTGALETLNELKARYDEALSTVWSEENKDAQLTAILNYYRVFGDGPWSQAICEAGAEAITLSEKGLEFSLRSFAPRLSEIPANLSPGEWILQAADNASFYDLELSLPLTEGTLSRESAEKLSAALSRSAAEAEREYRTDAFLTRLSNWLYPYRDLSSPPQEKAEHWESLSAFLKEEGSPAADLELQKLHPFFHSQRDLHLDTTEGPHALRFSGNGTNPEKLLQKAYDESYEHFTSYPRNTEVDEEAESDFLERVERQVRELAAAPDLKEPAAEAERTWEHYVFRLDLDELNRLPEDYLAYLQRYDYEKMEAPLLQAVYDWQHLPVLPLPSSGWKSGSQSGTQLNIYAPADGYARYLQLRRSSDSSIVVSAFINSGHVITIYAPEGMYYLQVASGQKWYGYEEFFGDEGAYGRSDDFEVKNSMYYHDIRLQTSDGNLSSYGTNKDAFKP